MRSSKSENMIFRANNQAVRCEISGKTQKACNPVSVLQSYRFNGWEKQVETLFLLIGWEEKHCSG